MQVLQPTIRRSALVLGVLVIGAMAGYCQSTPKADKPTYLRDIQPIFMGKCYRCHNAQDQSRFLPNWANYKTAYQHRFEIKRRVWDSWKGDYYKQPMPAGDGPECLSMTSQERALIKQWVDTGAAYGVAQAPGGGSLPKQERIRRGQHLFATICSACHQPNAQGIPGRFPPLADSDFLNADKSRAIKILLHGRQGDIVVNGHKFDNSMPQLPLSNDDIANALTYVYNSFGNSGKFVTPDEVKTLRAEKEQPQAPTAVAKAPLSPWE